MCTITYIPLADNSFVVTDNRDEAVSRDALLPQRYEELDAQLYYPRDKVAGGTWMGVSNHKNLICLMNGAFARHQRKTTYAKSRGVVVKELLASKNIKKAIESYDLTGIEQFYALIFTWQAEMKIYELVWDGTQRYIQPVDATQPKIWSAAMTYGTDQRKEREAYLADFLKDHQRSGITLQAIIDFHHREGNDEKEGMIIRRGILQTTSISQYSNIDQEESFYFESLIDDRVQEELIRF